MTVWDYLKANYEIIIAIAALIVSIASIGLAYLTIQVQRRHNRLSVKPIPEILLFKNEGVKINLKNLGVGPLRCKELLTKDSAGNAKPHMKDFLPTGLDLTGEIFTNRWDFTILPGESVTLLSISERGINQSPSENLKKAMEMLSALMISLSYTSIYDEEFPTYEKSLIWFN